MSDKNAEIDLLALVVTAGHISVHEPGCDLHIPGRWSTTTTVLAYTI